MPPMGKHAQTLLGTLILVCGLVIFCVEPPESFRVAHILAWILCWTTGLLLLFGLIGTHPIAAERRIAAERTDRRPTVPGSPVPTRDFRYGHRQWSRRAAAGFCMLLGFCLCAFGIGLTMWISRRDVAGIVVGAGLSIWGLVIADYGRRYLRVRIHIDDQGIEARLYYRTMRMHWDEVVALVRRRCSFPLLIGAGSGFAAAGIQAGTMHWVYSRRAKIWFSDQLTDADELADIIATATGLPWE